MSQPRVSPGMLFGVLLRQVARLELYEQRTHLSVPRVYRASGVRVPPWEQAKRVQGARGQGTRESSGEAGSAAGTAREAVPMILHPPFEISARLMPAVQIGGATLSLTVSGRRTADGRDIYEAWIDLPDGTEHEITDLRSGCQGGKVQEGMSALLGFLSAAAESRLYRERVRYSDDDSKRGSVLGGCAGLGGHVFG